MWTQNRFKQRCRDKRMVTEQGLYTDSMLEMCFSYMKPILHRALHSLAGELMNSRSRYTAESKAFVCIIRNCAPFLKATAASWIWTRKSPGRIVLASLSPSAFYPHAQWTIQQKPGFKNHGAFFVNAIACKKRFCSPIFQFQLGGCCAISSSLSFRIPWP